MITKRTEKLNIDSEVFSRAVDEIITRDGLKKTLASGKQMRIKFGADVTAATLHIGHAVNLWKMRTLQEYGHKVVFLIGDFTTRIGDPTGRTEARKKIKDEDVDAWAKNFVSQIGLILLTDKKVFEVRKNSEWYGSMQAGELIDLMSFFTHARLIERDMFRERIKSGKKILFPELVYPILQGYDSVKLESDITIIGSDQLFNENMGRFFQEKFGMPPQVLVTTAITPGLDGGEKMSKSRGNYIGLSDSPEDKFGKAMRLIDPLIIPYLESYTDVPLSEIEKIKEGLRKGTNPMEAKLFFAEELVGRYHGRTAAKEEKEKFLKMFSKKETPDSVREIMVSSCVWEPAEFLVKYGLAPSKSEARRLIRQRAVEIDGREIGISDKNMEFKTGSVVRVGKRKVVRVVIG